ncbi:hypothetical protein PybrP1_007326 [[Pythium] brassicae (nom. inval.)]|nr:hypothetical protein PybrP1_007326 [[Pythium] brassicae (nom. inval.)]
MENYSIYDEIGRGTHSFVYKARRKRSIEYVAVKSTAKSRMDKILNEVQLLHKLDSRHVLKFYNWYESQNHIWLILEFCIGGDLLNLITQDKSLPEDAVRLFGSELVAGLQYLHSNSIIFCDLKPASILIDEFGSLKLADFGLARRIPSRDAPANPPLAPGSPNYMAPELFHQPAVHSFASDFWALIQHDKLELPVPRCEMSASFWDLLGRLLDKDPYQRITWDDLVDHPFWESLPRLAKLRMPAQDIFDAGRRTSSQKAAGGTAGNSSNNHGADATKDAESSRRERGEADATLARRQAVLAADHASRDSSCTTDDVADEEESSEQSVDDGDSDGDDDDGELLAMHSFEQRGASFRPASAPAKPRASPGSTRAALAADSGANSGPNEKARALLDRSNRLRRNHSGDVPAVPGRQDSAAPRVPRTAPPAPTKQDGAAPHARFDGIFDRDGRLGAALKKVPKLLFLAADSAVKPIVCSDDIEETSVPPVRSEELRFTMLAPKELLSCATEKLESHLKDVYVSLKTASSSAADKCSVLGYLSTLCLHSKLANVIVNSSLLALLARMLASATVSGAPTAATSAVVSMVCLDLGVLFRFATFIAPSSPEQLQSLVATLVQTTRATTPDSSETERERLALQQARRRSLSCLGELLFYISTQKDWTFPVAGLECVVELLDASDLVLRHYAVRTLCNMLVRGSGRLLRALVSEQVALPLATGLVRLAGDASTVSLRATTTQALAQLVRHLRTAASAAQIAPRVRVAVLLLVSDVAVLQALWLGVASAHSSCDLAIASLNVLNAVLDIKPKRGDTDPRELAAVATRKAALLRDVASFSVLAKILETKSRFEDDARHASTSSSRRADPGDTRDGHRKRYTESEGSAPNVLRAKAMLFVHLAMHASTSFASQCIQLRYVDLLERILHPFAPHLRPQSDARAGERSVASSGDASERGAAAASPSKPARPRLAAVDVYLLQCALNLIKLTIRTALRLGAECISASDGDDGIEDRGLARQAVAAAPFELFDMLLRNPTCKTQLVRYFVANERREYSFFLRLMTKLLVAFPNEALSGAADDAAAATSVAVVVSELLLRLLQGSGGDVSVLLAVEREALFAQLLPAVALQLAGSSVHGAGLEDDVHVNCIRVLYVALLHSASDAVDAGDNGAPCRTAFVKEHVFPHIQSLLGSATAGGGVNENVWHFTVELLYGLVSRDPALMREIEASPPLVESVLALLRAPRDLDVHTLPSSATALARMLVEAKKPTGFDALYANGVVKSLLAGLEFAGADLAAPTAAAVDLLDVLYALLINRYEGVRKAKASRSALAAPPPTFDTLVLCAPLVVHLCAVSSAPHAAGSPQPQESPPKRTFAERDATDAERRDVAELASRCLVYLSQLFGDRLNSVVFVREAKQRGDDAIARAILSSLEQRSSDGFVALRVLLTLKNCLRCQQQPQPNQATSSSSSVRVTRWLLEHTKLHQRVKSMAVATKSGGSSSSSSTRDQIAKTASEIMRLCQSSPAAGGSSSSSRS